MVHIDITYDGDLHCTQTHRPSGTRIVTDAPKDNGGKGESFSPTDLVASALGSCMMTIMGIVAKRHLISLQGTKVEVIKEMIQEPVRRIGKLTVRFQMPKGIAESQRKLLERAALTCPVHQSLHPDIQIPVSFDYPD
ncbi:MAG: OsmC family peroxiredoxin [Candidatus Omnitrophica bacterium]|nr:OsmC family peroxiredoxin [Candidatus Omnitrophota bacterium]